MRVSEMEVISPRTVEELLDRLTDETRETRLLAGATDAAVRMKEGKWRPRIWLNMKNIPELRYIRDEADGIHIGPLTTHTDVIHSPLLRRKVPVLVQACREVGAVQIRNMGTLGGNLGTASPAGDTIPALFVLGAVLTLESAQGNRRVPVEDFFLGPGRTVLRKGEIIRDIRIPPRRENEIGIFEKLGPRKAQAIAIVNVAILLRMGDGTRECVEGRIAFGSVAPTVIRARKCEAALRLGPLTDETIADIAQMAWKEVVPISDIRASAAYRRDMACALLEKGLYRLMKRWEEE